MSILDFIRSWFARRQPKPAGLSGRLRYKINGAGDDPGKAGEITEGGFGEQPRRFGTSIAYGNLLCQHSGESCGPYLTATGTAKQYKERVPDPAGPGFEKNIRLQCKLSQSQGHRYIELDNPDDEHFSIDDVLLGLDLAAQYDLGSVAKNPWLLDEPHQLAYVRHPNVFGVIVEADCGTPEEMNSLRKAAGKPDLWVWFVFHSRDSYDEARRIAERAKKFKNMHVTYDKAKKEYGGDIEDLA